MLHHGLSYFVGYVDLSGDMRNNRIAAVVVQLVDISRFDSIAVASSLRVG